MGVDNTAMRGRLAESTEKNGLFGANGHIFSQSFQLFWRSSSEVRRKNSKESVEEVTNS